MVYAYTFWLRVGLVFGLTVGLGLGLGSALAFNFGAIVVQSAATSHHGVGGSQQISELVNESLILHQLGVDVVELSHAHRRRLLNVRVLILQAFSQGLAEVLGDLVHTDAAHGPHCQGADQRVGVFAILVEHSKC